MTNNPRAMQGDQKLEKSEFLFYHGSQFHAYDGKSVKDWFATDMEFIELIATSFHECKLMREKK